MLVHYAFIQNNSSLGRPQRHVQILANQLRTHRVTLEEAGMVVVDGRLRPRERHNSLDMRHTVLLAVALTVTTELDTLANAGLVALRLQLPVWHLVATRLRQLFQQHCR